VALVRALLEAFSPGGVGDFGRAFGGAYRIVRPGY